MAFHFYNGEINILRSWNASSSMLIVEKWWLATEQKITPMSRCVYYDMELKIYLLYIQLSCCHGYHNTSYVRFGKKGKIIVCVFSALTKDRFGLMGKTYWCQNNTVMQQYYVRLGKWFEYLCYFSWQKLDFGLKYQKKQCQNSNGKIKTNLKS